MKREMMFKIGIFVILNLFEMYNITFLKIFKHYFAISHLSKLNRLQWSFTNTSVTLCINTHKRKASYISIWWRLVLSINSLWFFTSLEIPSHISILILQDMLIQWDSHKTQFITAETDKLGPCNTTLSSVDDGTW